MRAFTPLPHFIGSKGRADFSSQSLSHFANSACDNLPRPPIPQIAEMAVTAIQPECQNGRVGGLIVSGCRKGARIKRGSRWVDHASTGELQAHGPTFRIKAQRAEAGWRRK